MKCKKCGGDTKVVLTLTQDTYIIRERRCQKCNTGLYTVEISNQEERVKKQFYAIRYQSRKMKKHNAKYSELTEP